jgi:hypothetical protein
VVQGLSEARYGTRVKVGFDIRRFVAIIQRQYWIRRTHQTVRHNDRVTFGSGGAL